MIAKETKTMSFETIVKQSGNGGRIILPKSLVGKKVKVTIQVMLCLAILTTTIMSITNIVYAQLFTAPVYPTSCMVELKGGQVVKVSNRDNNYTMIKCEQVQEIYSNMTLAQYQDQIRDPANDKREEKLNDFTENIDGWVESLNR